jgi:DNA-binding FadR family transcriptional regulator
VDQPFADKPSKRQRATGVLADLVGRVEESIDSGAWPPGFRLPTERDLEVEFGVARNTIRKGLRRLEDTGKITRHVGRGSFVADPQIQQVAPPDILTRMIGASPAEVMEIRLALEPWASSIAATHATATDLARMRECLARGEAARGVPEFEEWDGRLHEAIISSTKNGLLIAFYEAINLARHQPEWINLKTRSLTPERKILYQQHHSDLVDALQDRDGAAACELTRQHLLAVRTSLLGF